MSFLFSVGISFVTAFLTVLFSFWRFRSEKWWELKATTYSSIMEALHYIKKSSNAQRELFQQTMLSENEDYQQWEQEHMSISIDAQRQITSELTKKSKKALDEIEKIIDANSFIIDHQATTALIKLKKEYARVWHVDELDEYFDAQEKATKRCLIRVKKIAKSDMEPIMNKIIENAKKTANKR